MKTEKSTFTETVVDGLRNAATEIEEFRVQVALGKSEAKDLFEEMKKKMKSFIHDTKHKYRSVKDSETLKLVNAIEMLEVQLALGLAETKDVFEKQKKEITTTLNKLEAELRANDTMSELKANARLEIEKFKMKLELLSLQYKLKKLQVEYNLDKKKQEFADKLKNLQDKMISSEQKQQWKNFKKEMGEAYEHFKQAFGD